MLALSSNFRLKLRLLLVVTFTLSVGAAPAQSNAQIAQDLESVQTAERNHLPEAQQGILWERLAGEYHAATEFPKAENAYNKALHLLKNAPSAKEEYAATLDSFASLYLEYGRLDDAESVLKQANSMRQKLGDPNDIALTQEHLAGVALARHQFKKAERLASQGLATMETSAEPPRAGMLSAAITLTYARCSRGHCREGLVNAAEAVALAKRNFVAESAPTGFAMEALGFAEWKVGANQNGEKAMLRAIQILRTTLEPDDPRLAGAMLQYRAYLTEAKRQTEAEELYKQVKEITSQAGIDCQGCTVSVSSLSNSLR